MKRLVIFLLIIMFSMPSILGQVQDPGNKEIKETIKELKTEVKELKRLEGTSVSMKVMNAFTSDFGNIPDIKWERGLYLDKAEFTKEGIKMSAYYDSDAKLVGTTTVEKFADIPLKSQKEIKATYSDYKIDQVLFFKDNKANDTDMYLWDIQFADADNYFIVISKRTSKIILKVAPEGDVTVFKYVQ